MKILLLLLLFTSNTSFAEKAGTHTYCLWTQKEYHHCQKMKLDKCAARNKDIFYKELDCPKNTIIKKIEGGNPGLELGAFDWPDTCRSVQSEYKYCSKEKITDCADSMKERYSYLKCDIILEKKIDQ